MNINGTDGNDTLRGSYTADVISAGAGDDLIEGDLRDDTIDAGSGNDTIAFSYMPIGKVFATGGAGVDTYRFGSSAAGELVITDFAGGHNGDILQLSSLSIGWYQEDPFETGHMRLVQDGANTLLQYDQDGLSGTRYQYVTIVTLQNVEAASLTAWNFYGYHQTGAEPASTIAGTEGEDIVSGTSYPDLITGLDGDDKLGGLGGKDTIDGGAGNDRVFGGWHDDDLRGGDGNDVIGGEGGNDTVDGGAGDDQILSTRGTADLLLGGAGNDRITSEDSNDTQRGGDGDDTLRFSPINNPATPATDTVYLYGDAGNDTIRVSSGMSTLTQVVASGGIGVDTYLMSYRASALRITDFAPGAQGDKIDLLWLFFAQHDGSNPFAEPQLLRLEQRGADTVLVLNRTGVPSAPGPIDIVILENVTATSLTRDNFVGNISPLGAPDGMNWTGTDAWENITGGILPDRLAGAGGDDELEGGHGNDTLDGGTGHDGLEGGTGNDSLLGGEGHDYLAGAAGNDTMIGGEGNDFFFDEIGRNVMDGGAGDDQLYSWNADASYLSGGAGNDTLEGGSGMDTFVGGAGNDIIRGSQYAGRSFAIFEGAIADYQISVTGARDRTVAARAGGDTDIVENIDRIVFSDRAIALDQYGNGGKVYRLYQAAFDRTPDVGGVGFWIGMADQGIELTSIAAAFVASPEFAALYGSAPTNEALIRLFYVNALHRAPDEAGVAYWTNILDKGLASSATVLTGFSESAENIAATAAVVGQGFEYQPYP